MINFKIISSTFAVALVCICLLGIIMPQTANANLVVKSPIPIVNLVKNGRLTVCKIDKSSYEVVKTVKMVITAYSSTPEETDDTPFITASGKQVADGIIANNMLPMGTKLKIPGLYGDKVFTVEDRMNKRKSDYHADIWFPTKVEALKFGVKTATIEILES